MKKYLFILIIVSFLLLSAGFAAVAENATSIRPNKTVDLVCVQAAVNKRETAMQSAFNAWTGSINSALQTRQSELATAWTITEKAQRQTAIKNAWNKFKESKKNATQTFRKAKQVAWQQFKTDAKVCKTSVTGEDQGADISL